MPIIVCVSDVNLMWCENEEQVGDWNGTAAVASNVHATTITTGDWRST